MKTTKIEKQYLQHHAIHEDRKLKKIRIGFLIISTCFALLSIYCYFNHNENWREWGAISFVGIFFLILFWVISTPQRLKRLLKQDLSFKEIEDQLFEKKIQINTFKNISHKKQEEMMQKLRSEFNNMKENYDGKFKLRDYKDDYDIVANLLIIDMCHIENKEKVLFSIGENNFTTHQYYSELFTKTPFGIEFVKDYINGRVFIQEEETRKQYIAEKRKIIRRKQLPYFIGIVLLFLFIVYYIFK